MPGSECHWSARGTLKKDLSSGVTLKKSLLITGQVEGCSESHLSAGGAFRKSQVTWRGNLKKSQVSWRSIQKVTGQLGCLESYWSAEGAFRKSLVSTAARALGKDSLVSWRGIQKVTCSRGI